MGLQLKFVFLGFIKIFFIRHSLCDEFSLSDANKWTCTCSVAHKVNFNLVAANCSPSCDCNPAAGESERNRWKCVCSTGGLPILEDDDNDCRYFTSCDCNAGILSDLEPSKKQIPSRVGLIVLLLCIALTVLAITGSVVLYICRKDKVQWVPPTADRLTSCSSSIDSMSQAVSSVPLYRVHPDSNIKPLLGCTPKTSLLHRVGKGLIHRPIQFSYAELEIAACGFSDSNLIGVGGSSHVYRGNLRDGRTVAIKRMKVQLGPDAEKVFLAEIELISRLHHCHVVPLLGYCSEQQGKEVERLLVFEYIPHGNLRECLDGHSGKYLEWNTRVVIALGAARGLEYLHEAAAPSILHRDVKSTNILLDENWIAKITDLGMAKHLHKDGIVSCSSSPARMQGTFGYFAPEYAIIGRASLKSDVFSFGVVLLELITGRNPIYKASNKGDESLVIWATPRLQDSKRVILELPDPRLEGAFDLEEMQVMAYLAKECLLLDPDSRPSMSEVVQILSSIASDKCRRNKYAVQRHFQVMNDKYSDDEVVDLSEPRLESFWLIPV